MDVADFRAWIGLTQSEFADACGVTRTTVARWESSNPVPVPDWLGDALALSRPRLKSDGGQVVGEAVRAALKAWEGSKAKTPPPHPRHIILAALLAPDTLPAVVEIEGLLTRAATNKVFGDPTGTSR